MNTRNQAGAKTYQKIKEDIEMRTKLMGLLKDEKGQGMVEYGLILGLISIAAITVISLFGPQLINIFTKSKDAITIP